MRLYLVRHGKAEFGMEDDAGRHLSPRGRYDVDMIGQHLAAQDLPVKRILHSGLVRAHETAEILAMHLTPKVEPELLPGIEPWGDVKAFAQLAETWDQSTIVCGHEPFMGSAVSQLVTGKPGNDIVEVKTGSVMALSPSKWGGNWVLRWMLNPRVIRGPKTMED